MAQPLRSLVLVGACLATVLSDSVDIPRRSAGQRPDLLLTAEQKELLGYLSLVELDDGAGGTVKAIRITGVNLQLVNGLGATNGYPADPRTVAAAQTRTNGAGNLLIGYTTTGLSPAVRTGSHNLIVGDDHTYTRFGGLAVGRDHAIHGAFASATGGEDNRANGDWASCFGGHNSEARGSYASALGGSTSGALGDYSTILGGWMNTAENSFATVAGGRENAAQASYGAVFGGRFNTCSIDSAATVLGGIHNNASGPYALTAGGDTNSAEAHAASVHGGQENRATDLYSSVTGGVSNVADGPWSSVSGGLGRVVSALNQSGNLATDWVAGSLWEDF